MSLVIKSLIKNRLERRSLHLGQTQEYPEFKNCLHVRVSI